MLCRFWFFGCTLTVLLYFICLFFNLFRICLSLCFSIFVSFVFSNFCMSFLFTLSLPAHTRL
ncbi:hypothetical protein BZA70DRAFT_286186 [Myxozyma melibiosi]|uniref:Uncharacterized protein n=1 Tax=Myxozyma melibiosi TaxID=54550 RepID=A0ABR1EY18_9ASCO